MRALLSVEPAASCDPLPRVGLIRGPAPRLGCCRLWVFFLIKRATFTRKLQVAVGHAEVWVGPWPKCGLFFLNGWPTSPAPGCKSNMLSLVATLRGSRRVGSIRVAQRHGHPYMGGGFGNGSYWKFVVALGHEFTQHAAAGGS